MMCVKDNVLILTDMFQNCRNSSKSAFSINPLSPYSTPSFTWKDGLKDTGVELIYKNAEKLRFLLENNIGDGLASVLGFWKLSLLGCVLRNTKLGFWKLIWKNYVSILTTRKLC